MIGVSATAEESEVRKKLKAFIQDVFGEDSLDVYPYLGHLLSLKLGDAAQERIERLDAQALQNQYLSAMQRLLEVLSNRQPLVMVLEDLHWADPSSVELFSRLIPMASASPMLFCLATRVERESPGWQMVREARELMGSSLSEISLRTLTETDSKQLINNLLGLGALPNHIQKLILKKTEGNPLFVEEVIRMLIDRRAIIQKDNGWETGKTIGDINIPDNLQGLLLARIDRLPDDVKQVLRVAAVIGRQFPVQVLEQVLSNRIEA
jgi:predicted ATPase